MRKTLFTVTMALCVAAVVSVASSIAKNSNNPTAPETIVGVISCKECVAEKGATVSDEHEACAKQCIKHGSEAVLATEGGHVYKLDQQDKAREFAGKKVKVTGSVSGESISVTSIERD